MVKWKSISSPSFNFCTKLLTKANLADTGSGKVRPT